MRFINRKQLMSLPIGTIFSKAEMCNFQELMVFMGNINDGSDFNYICIDQPWFVEAEDSGEYGDIFYDMRDKQRSVTVDLETTSRDGLFEQDETYIVWEEKDVKSLISLLTHSLLTAYTRLQLD